MKTHEMTAEQIAEDIKSGNAYVENIAVCGNLFNRGNEPYFINIDGVKIVGMKKNKEGNYDIDKVTLVSEAPDQHIMALAQQIKKAADATAVEVENLPEFKWFFE